ncbi:hypothetical protein FA15DRAFT_235562 [Coprinopsis marcescibilis]|uniref:Mediator of RNA polymerase II transcription subunit 13 n=1 Tax=Coprinopsis marcescibilis TaxID=230819 RepID=A0A5C3L2M6_COPMA|nr:hypothetical protein FA15DRAFT_235562 [Coprinopsis marcescibilis]
MASKAVTPSYSLPQISPSDRVLAVRIPLPTNPNVAFAVYHPTDSSAHDSIELARRTVLSTSSASELVGTIIWNVQSGPAPALYLFAVSSQESLDSVQESLRQFTFPNLTLTKQSSFRVQDLSRCAASTSLFAHLLNPSSNPHEPSLVQVYSRFLDAVRSRAIVNITDTSSGCDIPTSGQVRRFKEGFIIHRTSVVSDWASDWEHRVLHRPVVYFHLQVQLSYNSGDSPSHLLIHATPLSTPLSNLPLGPSLSPGSPIVLLPYGIPAFFLAPYKGPSQALSKLFDESLQGLGAGPWFSPENSNSGHGAPQPPRFIIGWIRVENKQGEDKGTTFIWPTRLCLSYLPSYRTAPPLDPLPELPPPLQASPQLGTQSAQLRPLHQLLSSHQSNGTSLAAFRSLMTSKPKDMHQTVEEVGTYVDNVARDRERERERLKKERESGTSPKLAKRTPPTPTPAAVPFPVPTVPVRPAFPPTSVAQQAISDQNFYPSPPQTSQISAPEKEQPRNTRVQPFAQPPATTFSALMPSTTPETRPKHEDSFPNVNNWSQPSESYMNLDMDFGMDVDLNFNVNMNASGSGNTNTYNNHETNLDFEDFTEDDFSFFDQPSKSSARPPELALPTPTQDKVFPSTKSTPTKPTMVTPAISIGRQAEEVHFSGPGPPPPWTPGDMFTPRSAVDASEPPPPELVPSSPGQSPETHPSPRTPGVQLSFDANVKRNGINNHTSTLFDPIPFSSYHRIADSKYESGKFAFIEPDSDQEQCLSLSSPATSSERENWRRRYNSITDPRVGIVKKLIGVKRKLTDINSVKPRNRAFSLSWLEAAQEEWRKPGFEREGSPMDVDSRSDPDSDSDEETTFESDTESPVFSRPATPPPSYLPLGPTLLHHQFDHSQLLPLSTPSRPPGSSPEPTNIGTAHPMASVPTPVSPAAMVGAASEKAKVLETLATSIAVESVENPLWAETWQATNRKTVKLPDVWPDDLKMAANLLERIPSVEGPLDLGHLTDPHSPPSKGFQPLEQPHITVGKADAVLQVLPSALRFWDKLGLGPKGGSKDVEVYVIHELGDERIQPLVEKWLETVGAAYKLKRFGQMTTGTCSVAENGLLAVRFDAGFRKVLTNLLTSLDDAADPVLVFIIVPVAFMTVASPALRHVLTAVSKVFSDNVMDRELVFQLVPQPFILEMEESPKSRDLLDAVCSSVYNRIRVSVERRGASRGFGNGPILRLFQEPAFTIARPVHNKVTYSRSASTSLDVLDRFTLLHAAYTVTPCKKWILAACIDQRGESYDLGLWHVKSDDESEGETISEEINVVGKVMDFVLAFARKADVEWRMIISKLGLLSDTEIRAWDNRIDVALKTGNAAHVYLVSAELDAPWIILDPKTSTASSPVKHLRTSTSSSKHNTVFTDASCITYAIHQVSQLSMATPPPLSSFSVSMIPEPAGQCQESRHSDGTHLEIQQEIPHPLPALPRSTTALLSIASSGSHRQTSMLHIHLLKSYHSNPSYSMPNDTTTHHDITHNFFELSTISARFRLKAKPVLPFHLAAVDCMWNCLNFDWERLEGVNES